MQRFPHLQNANAWPGLDTVDPFDLQVTFDPFLWTPDVTIHLCRTKLDAEYRNVGGWSSPENRDTWFDRQSEATVRLDTEMHILPNTEIKLPFAFEVLNHYNQLYIDFPPTPTADGSTESVRYYFFITDVQYRSPSSTACKIMVDEWSTHLFDINLNYISLERGHAPMSEISADDYLSNPRDNCELLTTPDENFGGGERLRYTASTIINAGPHWLVFSMTADPEQDPGTYGHRENWRVPTSSAYRVQGAISTPVFAIEPADANFMINRLNERAPQLMPTIQAVFLIPKRYVTTGTSFSFLGVSCHEIEPVQQVSNFITLTPSLFAYPERYRDIAKLYTMPYAWLELTDETGRTQTIAVEDTTGRLRVSVIASILAPFIGVDAYVAGIGNSLESTITWENMTSHAFAAYGDWTRSLRHWNIPTYAILQNSERAFEWSNHWQREQARTTNQQAYDLSIAVNNLNYSLRGAGLDRQAARLAQKQANDRSQLSLSLGADASAVTLGNARIEAEVEDDKELSDNLLDLNTAALALAASQAGADAIMAEGHASIGLSLAQSYQDHVHNQGTYEMVDSVIGAGENMLNTGLNAGQSMMEGGGLGIAVGSAELVTGTLSSLNSVMSTMDQVAYNETAAQSSTAQAQLQLNGARLSYAQTRATYTMQMSNNQAAHGAVVQNMRQKKWIAKQYAIDANGIKSNLQQNSLSTQQSYETAISNGDIALARAQAGSTKGMSDRSALQRKGIQDEALANAHRAGRLGSPKVFAQPTGSSSNYTRPQVLLCNVKTQDAGAIAAAGDTFLRYGYRFGGRQWTVRTLTPMGHFTYWQGEAHIGSSTNEVTKSIIRQVFAEGVFVWRNPSDIGNVSIYDN